MMEQIDYVDLFQSLGRSNRGPDNPIMIKSLEDMMNNLREDYLLRQKIELRKKKIESL